MKILFLSNQNSCRSQMAESILRFFGKSLEIYSARIKPADHISPKVIAVLAEIGIELKPTKPQHYSKFENLKFDYLITVGDETNEELKIPSLKYKLKLHLGFKTRNELKQKCRTICREIYS